jgi:hypothetical protein
MDYQVHQGKDFVCNNGKYRKSTAQDREAGTLNENFP